MVGRVRTLRSPLFERTGEERTLPFSLTNGQSPAERSFANWLELRVETKLICPAYQHDGMPYVSKYQIWQVDRLSNKDLELEPPAILSAFEVFLNLMVRI
jgi:hypothetical protein